MLWLVSDQRSHFKNRLIASVTTGLHIGHHFTTAYSPWPNGSVERVRREVLRATKSLLSEWTLPSQDWPAVTECVQSVLNRAPLKRLGLRGAELPGVYRTPVEVCTEQKPVRPWVRALPLSQHTYAHSSDELHLRRLVNIDRTQ